MVPGAPFRLRFGSLTFSWADLSSAVTPATWMGPLYEYVALSPALSLLSVFFASTGPSACRADGSVGPSCQRWLCLPCLAPVPLGFLPRELSEGAAGPCCSLVCGTGYAISSPRSSLEDRDNLGGFAVTFCEKFLFVPFFSASLLSWAWKEEWFFLK